MEPGSALKRSFPTVEWRVWKRPPEDDSKERSEPPEAVEPRLAKKPRVQGVTCSQRHRVYPLWTVETGWRTSLKDHLRMPLWPESMPREGRLLGFWMALCFRPEMARVELWHQAVRRLCILSWQNYVVVLDLSQGPLTSPGPLSFQVASLWELSQQAQSVATLSQAMRAEPDDWQILLYLHQLPQPSLLLRWSELSTDS